jgi:hypothetical protein
MHVTNKLRVVTRTVQTDGRTTEATATAGRSLPTNSAYAAELDHRLTSPLPGAYTRLSRGSSAIARRCDQSDTRLRR